MKYMPWFALIAMVSIFAGRPADAQTLAGRVLDGDTGRPIANAFVEVLGEDEERLAGTFTGGNGRFSIAVPTLEGPGQLTVGAIGYGRGLWDVPMPEEGQTSDFGDLEIQPVPIELAPLDVQVERSRLTPGREWVRRRQLLGRGQFFPGALLTALNPQSVSRYLSEQTEFWVRYDERGTPSLTLPWGGCVLMHVNEWPINAAMSGTVPRPRVGVQSVDRPPAASSSELREMGFPSLDDIPLEWIAAIEVYEEMRDVPPGRLQFTSSGAHPCAIINVWTWDSW